MHPGLALDQFTFFKGLSLVSSCLYSCQCVIGSQSSLLSSRHEDKGEIKKLFHSKITKKRNQP